MSMMVRHRPQPVSFPPAHEAYGETEIEQMSNREIVIAGQALVFAIGRIDFDDSVYGYVVVTQDMRTGDCRGGRVRRLADSEDLDWVQEQFPGNGYPTETRCDAVAWAVDSAGYGTLRY